MTTVFQKSISASNSSFLPRIARSDKRAAQECIDAYGAMIWAMARQAVDSNEAAEKAVREIFIDIWENAAFCDLEISDESVWIAMIVRHRLAGYSFKESVALTPENFILTKQSGVIGA